MPGRYPTWDTNGTPSPYNIWWLGFDTAHSGDLIPGIASPFDLPSGDIYRNLEYVSTKCANLAEALLLPMEAKNEADR